MSWIVFGLFLTMGGFALARDRARSPAESAQGAEHPSLPGPRPRALLASVHRTLAGVSALLIIVGSYQLYRVTGTELWPTATGRIIYSARSARGSLQYGQYGYLRYEYRTNDIRRFGEVYGRGSEEYIRSMFTAAPGTRLQLKVNPLWPSDSVPVRPMEWRDLMVLILGVFFAVLTFLIGAVRRRAMRPA